MSINKSIEMYSEAVKVIPGGVNSPVRAFNGVGGNPLFIKKAKGSTITDVDGNDYIDFVSSWGPMILGHSHPTVLNAVREQLEFGMSFGAPTEKEIELANLVTEMVSSIEVVRLVNSGTEATMSAIRVARGHTNRDKIIKFEGCYHGHADSFLIKAGSGLTTLGNPSSAGVPQNVVADTLLAKYNDIESVKKLFKEHKDEIAAIIIEPVAANMGLITPEENFLKELREVATENKSLLVFDEVITGFRLCAGGAQEYYGVQADLVTFGKIIGGGMPIGAYGGSKDIMDIVAPIGPVYQAGTLSGNPVAVTAGIETLKLLKDKNVYEDINRKGKMLVDGYKSVLKKLGLEFTINSIGSLATVFFTNEAVTDYDSALKSDTELFAKYFQLMLEEGIYLGPSQYEAAFISHAHTDEEIERTVQAFENVMTKMFR